MYSSSTTTAAASSTATAIMYGKATIKGNKSSSSNHVKVNSGLLKRKGESTTTRTNQHALS